MSVTVTIPMRAAGVCATELLHVLDTTHAVGMPLAPLSVKKCADRVLDAAIQHDRAAERRALLITAATALLIIAAMDSVDGRDPEEVTQ